MLDGPAIVKRSSPLLLLANERCGRYVCDIAFDSTLLRPNKIFDSLNNKMLFIDSVSHGNGRTPICCDGDVDFVIGFDLATFGTR